MEQTEEEPPKQRGRPGTDAPKWRSFPKVPNLLQYVSTGLYYARVQIRGNNIRKSLKTKVWSTARLRLRDFLTEHETRPPLLETIPFPTAVAGLEASLILDTELKESSRQFRRWCIATLKKSWPELWEQSVNDITAEECKTWAARIRKEFSGQYYNNVIGTLKLILDHGIEEHLRQGGHLFQNPAKTVPKASPGKKDLTLPEPDQFGKLVEAIRRQPGKLSLRIADQVEFLAYSGMRAFSEANWVNWEDIDWQREELIIRGHPETRTKNNESRRVPIIADMHELLNRLDAGNKLSGRILKTERCERRLRLACVEIGIPAITLHDLRHLFATRCIESGVDIPTVSRWLGHKDGGALAMKTYGHLRNEHSKAMAKKVRF